jgi:hypothetical protein
MGRKARIAGWVLSILIALFMIGASAVPKFIDWPGKQDLFEKMGWSISTMQKIGVVEVLVALLFIIPRIDFIGVILLTAYLGGATCAHVRIGDAPFFPIGLGIIAWVAFGLRHPAIFQITMGDYPDRSVRPRGFDVTSR